MGIVLVSLLCLLTTRAGASFSATSARSASFTAAVAADWDPQSVLATRTDAATCTVTWTPAKSLPPGVTYDITDDRGDSLTALSTLTAALGVPAQPVTLTVRARLGNWTSAAGRASNLCLGYPDAPVPVVADASDGRIDVSWQDPEPNGGRSRFATVTASPGGECVAQAPDTSCRITGLTNGVESTVTVTVTSDVGTGPASAPVVATPYPSDVIDDKATALWLDAAHLGDLQTSDGETAQEGRQAVVWRDRSTAGRHAVQKDPAKQAVVASLNGHPALMFDGSATSYWLETGASTLDALDAAPSAIYTVATQEAGEAGDPRYVISWGDPAGYTRTLGRAKGDDRALLGRLDDVDSMTPTLDWTYSGPKADSRVGTLVDGIIRPADVELNVNGALSYAWSGDVSTRSRVVDAAVGGLMWKDDYAWKGRIGEVIVLDGELTAAQHREVQEYLAHKWGIPITPSAPGIRVTATDGSAEVTPVAGWDGGSEITSYTVDVSGGGRGCTVTRSEKSCTIKGLTDGVSYTVTVTAVNALGSGLPASTTVIPYPARVMTPAGTRLWLDAQDPGSMFSDTKGTTVATPDGPVARWTDRSASHWDAVLADKTVPPVLEAATLGGHPAITFVKSPSQWLEVTGKGIGSVGSKDRTVFAVGSVRGTLPGAGGNAGAFLGWPAARGQGIGGYGYPTADSIGMQAYSSTGSQMYAIDTFHGTTVAAMVASSSAGALTSSIVVNGRAPVSQSAKGSWAGYGDLVRIGAAGDGAYALDGEIGELIVFDTALTPADQRIVSEYLARKWSQSITPAAPSGVSATTVAAGAVDVSWAESGWDGGAPIKDYTATASPSGLTCTAAPGKAACRISGLTPGSTQTITVAAYNGVGTGPASAPVSVIP